VYDRTSWFEGEGDAATRPSGDGPVEGNDRVLERAHEVKVTRRPVRPVSRDCRVRVRSCTTHNRSRVRVTRRPVRPVSRYLKV